MRIRSIAGAALVSGVLTAGALASPVACESGQSLTHFRSYGTAGCYVGNLLFYSFAQTQGATDFQNGQTPPSSPTEDDITVWTGYTGGVVSVQFVFSAPNPLEVAVNQKIMDTIRYYVKPNLAGVTVDAMKVDSVGGVLDGTASDPDSDWPLQASSKMMYGSNVVGGSEILHAASSPLAEELQTRQTASGLGLTNPLLIRDYETVMGGVSATNDSTITARITSVTNYFTEGGSPVPEPVGMVLLGSGLCAIAILSRRRRG